MLKYKYVIKNYEICFCSASLSIITPFYSACLVETVQSNIASEKTAFYDVFKEGFIRLLQWNCPQKGMLLKLIYKLNEINKLSINLSTNNNTSIFYKILTV